MCVTYVENSLVVDVLAGNDGIDDLSLELLSELLSANLGAVLR